MKLKKFRWSQVYESSEEELLDFMQARKITAERWEAESGEELKERNIDHETTIWCAEGSLTMHIDGRAISMQPGDALRVPANSALEVNAGISGCVCYES